MNINTQKELTIPRPLLASILLASALCLPAWASAEEEELDVTMQLVESSDDAEAFEMRLDIVPEPLGMSGTEDMEFFRGELEGEDDDGSEDVDEPEESLEREIADREGGFERRFEEEQVDEADEADETDTREEAEPVDDVEGEEEHDITEEEAGDEDVGDEDIADEDIVEEDVVEEEVIEEDVVEEDVVEEDVAEEEVIEEEIIEEDVVEEDVVEEDVAEYINDSHCQENCSLTSTLL